MYIENIGIFHDSMERCKTNKVLAAAIDNSIKEQFFFGENDAIEKKYPVREVHLSVSEAVELDCKPRFEKTNVIVSDKRTIQAASAYKGKRICVLNFASAVMPGGLVEAGATTQEESICRISTLYPCISVQEMQDKFYVPHFKKWGDESNGSMYNEDLIYTPDVVVFKSDDLSPKLLSEEEWFKVDVVTCAAPNLVGNYSLGNLMAGLVINAHLIRFTRILYFAYMYNVDVVILGAFGCGAFRNRPELVSTAALRALSRFKKCFETIEFAVYRPEDSYSHSYDVFKAKESDFIIHAN